MRCIFIIIYILSCCLIVTAAPSPNFRRVVDRWPPVEPLNRSRKWPQYGGLDPSVLSDIEAEVAAETSIPPLILGVSLDSHDCTLAAVSNGRVVAAIELERMLKQRYFLLMSAGYETIVDALEATVVPALGQICSMVSRRPVPCRLHYHAAVVAWGLYDRFSRYLHKFVHADRWINVDHHHAHAAYGWLSSPFYHELSEGAQGATVVLSYDGAGNDGTLRTFLGFSGNPILTPLGSPRRQYSYGFAYDTAASVVRELAWGSPYGSKPPCPMPSQNHFACIMALPGSFMAFAATGSFREEWRRGAELFLKRGLWYKTRWPSPAGGCCDLIQTKSRGGPPFTPGGINHYFSCDAANEMLSRQLDRDFAATIQAVFEIVIVNEVRQRLSLLGGLKATSLVITGGCALNVKVNSALARSFDLRTHVPSAPGDNGLAVGAAWLVSPPIVSFWQELKFIGAPLLEPLGEIPFANKASTALLEELGARWGAMPLQSVDQLAKLLLEGAIVGVARGRAEFGPRALGHRSLLAAADRLEQKDRLNRLKNRRWYRPCAPITRAEDLKLLFKPGPDLVLGSSQMSFAPPLRPWVKERFPAIVHLDNTARPQGVHEDDDVWMYSLLKAMRSAMDDELRSGPTGDSEGACVDEFGEDSPNISDWSACVPPSVGVLINTSLNPKGKPIAADIGDALSLFCEATGDELDFILLGEHMLFKRATAVSLGLCEGLTEKGILAAGTGGFSDGLPPI